MSLIRCDPRAFARCPYKRSCVRIEEATFTEGSDCHRFNEKVLRQPVTNADMLRAMEDQELVKLLFRLDNSDEVLHYCQAKQECMDIIDHEQNVPDSWCKKCLLKWLKAPADQEAWEVR